MKGKRKQRDAPEDRLAHPWPAFGAIALAWAFLFGRLLAQGRIFVFRDAIIHTWTERALLANALHAWHIPQWNDRVAFGTQFGLINGAVYPPAWLVGLIPLPFSMDLITALHVLFAGLGVALLARRFGAQNAGIVLAGIAFMYCGYVVSFAPYETFTSTAWLPWIAWATDRLVAREGDRRSAALVLAAMVAAQLLAGDPAAAITSGLVSLIIFAARGIRPLPAAAGWLAAAFAAALLLAAASVLPGLSLLPHTSRATATFSAATVWSLHPWRLLELLWPRSLGNPLDAASNLAELVANAGGGQLEPSMTSGLYLGAPILALALVAARGGTRRGGWLLLGAGGLTLLALGRYTPVYQVYRAIFVPERAIRYPEKHLVGALCLVCALAGAGLSELPRRARSAIVWLTACTGVLALELAVFAALRGSLEKRLAFEANLLSPPLDLHSIASESLAAGLVALAVAAAVAALLIAAVLRPRIRGPAVALAVIAYAAHAGWEAWKITPVADPAPLAKPPALLHQAIAQLQTSQPPPRLFRSPMIEVGLSPEDAPAFWQQTLFSDVPGRFGFDAVPGFEAWRSAEFAEFWKLAGRMPLDAFFSRFAVDYAAVPSDVRARLFSAPGRASLAELELGSAASDPEGNQRWTLAPVASARPRAFVAPRWRWTSEAETLRAFLDGHDAKAFNEVLLQGTGPSGGTDQALSPCDFTAYAPEHISLRCRSASGGYAVLADEDADGWSATVDGNAAPIVRADLLLRAVAVTGGEHAVEFDYRAPGLMAGVVLSLLAWAGWVFLFLRARPGGPQ